MTRRKRNIVLGIIAVLVVAELGFRTLRGPVGRVTIINASNETIEDLRAEFAGKVARVAQIPAGESVSVSLSGRGRQMLNVTYRLKGSALPGFQVATFDPSALQSDGSKLVLTIRLDEWERYNEQETSNLGMLASRATNWIVESLTSP